MSIDFSVKIGRLKLKNPVLTGSGTFGYGTEYEKFVDIDKLGGIIVKGISLKPKEGNPPPRICETPCGMLNSIGLQNVGVDEFYLKKLPFLEDKKCKIIVNVLGDTFEDYVEICEIVRERGGVDGVEINVSCPNVKKGGIHISQSPETIKNLTEILRNTLKEIPLLVKLSPNVTDIVPFVNAVKKGGADGVTLSNTFVGISIDVKSLRPKLSRIKGGLSGPAIKPIAQRIVFDAATNCALPIIASGGIMDYIDALEYLALGARAFEVGTANFINPCVTIEILEGIEKYFVENEIKSINEYIGAFLRKNNLRYPLMEEING